MLDFNKKGVFSLEEMVDYLPDGINRAEVMKNDKLFMVVMAFAKQVKLPEHTAPGNALLTVLDGEAVVTKGGEEYVLGKGQSITFAKGEAHSVQTRDERMKLSLLIDLA